MYRVAVILVMLGCIISCAGPDATAPSPLPSAVAASASNPAPRPAPVDVARSVDTLALSATTDPEDIAIAAASPYDGNYRGNWNGKIGGTVYNELLTFQVRGTVITITQPLRLKGTVTNGMVSMINVSDPQIRTLKCTVKGTLKSSRGKRSGLGTWSCADTKIRDLKGVGKWNAEVR